MNKRPEAGDFSPYYQHYIDKVEGDNALHTLQDKQDEMYRFWESIPEDKWTYRYEASKWTPKEMLLHLIDAERVFAYRALRIARKDKLNLLGFDHNNFVVNSEANNRPVVTLLKEYSSVRNATICLFESFTEEMWLEKGSASDHAVTALALAYIISGHELHHVDILKEMYLS